MNSQLQQQGFVIYNRDNKLRDYLLNSYAHDFLSFCQTWKGLPKDPYLLDGGSYRHRRYSVFKYQNKKLSALPYEPHFQTQHYNSLHGGINRHLEGWNQTTVDNPVLLKMIDWVVQQVDDKSKQAWRIQSHQFRIIASDQSVGKPTPEGVHKDGADYIFIMLMQRSNIVGGVSEVYDNDRKLLGRATLERSGDFILLDDRAVYHGVSEISAVNSSEEGQRDVLVLTFHLDSTAKEQK